MAKIPTYVQQGQYQAGRRANPGDFEGGQGLSAIGSAVSQVGDLSLKFLDLQQSTLVNDSLANAQSKLIQFESLESENPDFMGKTKRYEEAAQKIKNEFSSGLLPRYAAEFNDRFEPLSARGQARVRKSAWTGLIDSAKASLDESQRTMSVDALNAETPEERDDIIQQFNGTLALRVSQGLISEADGVAREYRFLDSIMAGTVRQLIQENPKSAIDQLGDPDGQFAAASPEKQGIWMDRAIQAYDSKLREEANAETREYRNNETLRKRDARIAKNAILTHIESRDLGKAKELLSENMGILDASDYRTFAQAIQAGGFTAPSEDNPVIYSELSRMASSDVEDLREFDVPYREGELGRDEIVADLIDKHYLDRQITKATRDQLIKSSKNHRFDTAGKTLHNMIQSSMKAGQFVTPAVLRANQEIAMEWEEWKIENERASRREAFDKVEELVGSLKTRSQKNNTAKDISEYQQQLNALIAAVNSGAITEEEFNENLSRLRTQTDTEAEQ